MPADRNKAIMFYASKLEQGVASIDKPVEDNDTAKAPALIPVHRCQWAERWNPVVLKEPDWLKTKNNA